MFTETKRNVNLFEYKETKIFIPSFVYCDRYIYILEIFCIFQMPGVMVNKTDAQEKNRRLGEIPWHGICVY